MADRGISFIYDGRTVSFAGGAFNGNEIISAEIHILAYGRMVLGKRGGGEIGGILLRTFGKDDFKPIFYLADAYADCCLFAAADTNQTYKQVDARNKINLSGESLKMRRSVKSAAF